MSSARKREAPWSDRSAAVFVLALGIVLMIGIQEIPNEGSRSVGPRAFPLMIAILTTVVGLVLIGQEVIRTRAERCPGGEQAVGALDAEESRWVRPHWTAVLGTIGCLIAYIVALESIGYWQTTVVFFVAVCRVLGSRRLWRDCLIAIIIAGAIFLAFDQLLGVTLPPGFIKLDI